MYFIETFDQANQIAGAALKLMEQQGVPPTPQNFTIWYAHQTGRYPDLSRTIEILVENRSDFTAERNEELFEKFFGSAAREDEIGRTSEELSTILDQMVTYVGEAGENTSRYGAQLKDLSGTIAKVSSQDDLHTLINGVLLETRRMEARNQELEDKLNQSSAKVGDLSQRLEDVKREAMTDALTGIANRKCFDIRLRESASEAVQEGTPLSLLMIDIDHFKKFNDSYGHLLGDQVLKLIGKVVGDSVKGRDTPARYGGEEFAIILPRTALEDAATLAEDIRKTVANKKVTRKNSGEQLGQITLSIGVALYRAGEPLCEFIGRADEALYSAKRDGRNRVVSEANYPGMGAAGSAAVNE